MSYSITFRWNLKMETKEFIYRRQRVLENAPRILFGEEQG